MAISQLQLDEANLMSRIASGCRLDAVFNWLRNNKQSAEPNDLFWAMAQHWQHITATYHKGNGGLKQAVQKVRAKLSTHGFVCKTDIDDSYLSIKHDLLLEKLRYKITGNHVIKFLQQILSIEYMCAMA